MKAGRAKNGIFQKMRIKNLRGVSIKKTRLLLLGNVDISPHPQLFAQRAPEG